MEYFKKLVGDRIYLSPISANDLEKFTKWQNNFEVTDYTGCSHRLYNKQAEENWMNDVMTKEQYVFSIVALDTDEVIGNLGLHKVDLINRTATLGILIGEKEYRSKGYGTEAIRLLLDFAFNYLNLNSVSLTLLSCNERAKKCYEKVGFKEFGIQRQCRYVNGKYYDFIYMDMLAEEFKGEFIKNKNL